MHLFRDKKTGLSIKRVVDIALIEDIYYQKILIIKDSKLDSIRKEIAEVDDKLPLYDTYSENLYLIRKHSIYFRVMKNHYRLPTQSLLKELKDRKIDSDDPLRDRIIKKRDLIIDFMSHYDLDILEKTYMRVFYEYSDEVGKNLTTCKRPSFIRQFKHLQPYYTRSELINIALNMGIIKPSKIYYSPEKIDELCRKTSINDLSSDTIIQHHRHIIDARAVGVVQYYSLQGSYFMNQYLRGMVDYRSKNNFLDELVKTMKKIVKGAPAFDQEYIVYRFVQDDYIANLNIGDIFVDKGFMSTTRDPFYNSDEFKFGFILIKIRIPKGKRGMGLCMETVSHFPKEQEIILAPGTQLKLIKKDNMCPYYHTSMNFATKVRTRYEFKIVGIEEISHQYNGEFIPEKIRFLDLPILRGTTFEEKLSKFVRQHCGEQYRFVVDIGDKSYNTVVEWYDSSSVYSEFYRVSSKNGVCMYSIDKDRVSFMLELTKDAMYVNFYFKHSLTDRDMGIDQDKFLVFVSSVAYHFGIGRVIIWTDYEMSEYGFGLGNHCRDFYEYLTKGIKRFPEDDPAIKPKFRYYDLDRMDNIRVLDIVDKEDSELYQIHKRLYDGKKGFKAFYLWIVNNYSYLVGALINNTAKVFPENNPFLSDFYILNPNSYLHSRKLISFYKDYGYIDYDVATPPKNIYRLKAERRRASTNRVV